MNLEETTEITEPEAEAEAPVESTPEDRAEEILQTAQQEMLESIRDEETEEIVEETQEVETETPPEPDKQTKALAQIAQKEKQIRDWEAQNKDLLSAGHAAYNIKDLISKKQYWQVLEQLGITDANLLEDPVELPPEDEEKKQLRLQLQQSQQDLQNQKNEQELAAFEKETTKFIKANNNDFPILSGYIDANSNEVIDTIINTWEADQDNFNKEECLKTMERSLIELGDNLNRWRGITNTPALVKKKVKKTLTNASASAPKNKRPKATTDEERESNAAKILKAAQKELNY